MQLYLPASLRLVFPPSLTTPPNPTYVVLCSPSPSRVVRLRFSNISAQPHAKSRAPKFHKPAQIHKRSTKHIFGSMAIQAQINTLILLGSDSQCPHCFLFSSTVGRQFRIRSRKTGDVTTLRLVVLKSCPIYFEHGVK